MKVLTKIEIQGCMCARAWVYMYDVCRDPVGSKKIKEQLCRFDPPSPFPSPCLRSSEAEGRSGMFEPFFPAHQSFIFLM